MASTTAIRQAKQAIVTALQASSALSAQKILVSYGHPGERRATLEMAYTDRGRTKGEWAGAGGARNDVVTIELIVIAKVKGGNCSDAETRLETILELVEDAIAGVTGPTPTGPFMRPDGITSVEDTNYPYSEGWGAEARLEVTGLIRTT